MGCWFPSLGSRKGARRLLFCFPYAGAGIGIYREWGKRLPSHIEVVPVELPGRGNRFRESPFRRFPDLVPALADAVWPLLDREYVFFGHSMGALIAFELARELRRRRSGQPELLLVSGRKAPQIPDTDSTRYNLADAEFMASLQRLNGTPREVLEHKELMALMLPLLRADFELIETYKYENGDPLDCPITAFGGTLDLEASQDMLLPWKAQTVTEFALHMLRGDHFFLRSAELLQLLSRELLKTG